MKKQLILTLVAAVLAVSAMAPAAHAATRGGITLPGGGPATIPPVTP